MDPLRVACIAYLPSLLALVLLWPSAATADPCFFSTGNPDGQIATLSRTASTGKLETETADDFVTSAPTVITSATFTGPDSTRCSACRH